MCIRDRNEIPEWLSRIDEVRFEKFGVSPELARDIEEGAGESGETVAYEVADVYKRQLLMKRASPCGASMLELNVE